MLPSRPLGKNSPKHRLQTCATKLFMVLREGALNHRRFPFSEDN